ncbi:hypothetical protein [Microbacterium candidum]|uniref:Uncharacterized protein n=1 Tax=Microbacterium candidum TaxID=3041922 RepID=A0ABT7MY17_9MICO|nr:hypothetical protein [Microbacterium sp. ASV49]MDL9979347.1 hypothetical protein [Microbacterium sp. ASV49]
MFAELAFFSFVELTDPSQHGSYNRWHLFDHRPENLALPGVAWGERWAVTDESRAQPGADPEFAGVDYVAMYWFRPPVEQSVREWDALGEASFQWGRGPIIPGVRRPMLAFFLPVKGYSSASALVSPEVLPYRPNRGVQVTATRFDDPHALDVHAAHEYEDRMLIPRLLEVDGVAGVWTFSYSHPQRHSSLPFDESPVQAPGSVRVRLVYLDGDPTETAARVREIEADAPAVGERMLSATAAAIDPVRYPGA